MIWFLIGLSVGCFCGYISCGLLVSNREVEEVAAAKREASGYRELAEVYHQKINSIGFLDGPIEREGQLYHSSVDEK